MATRPKETDDEFSSAFSQFASAGEPPANDPGAGDPPADPPVASGGDDGDPAGGDAGGNDSLAGGDGAPAGEAGQAPDPTPQAPAGDQGAAPAEPAARSTDADAILERLTELVKNPPAEVTPPPPAAPVQPAPEAAEIYTPDEKQFLAEYDKDWADVARGESLKRRGEYQELVSFVFSEVAKQLTPMIQTLETLAVRTHLSDLETRVSDYDAVRDKVVAWVDTQPAYLQAAYRQVINSGTADEVADLVERYRAATGEVVPQATPTPPRQAELPDDAKQAAKALAPLSTKRSVIPQEESSDDFDSAFKQWAAGKLK